MDCRHVAIRAPGRISSARDTAGLYPEARKAGDAPSGRAHCSGPGTPTKCQYRADALRAQEALTKRLRKFSLTLEPTKTKLVEFGRYAHRHASKRGRNARRRPTSWPLPCTALAIRKATFGLDCLRKSHDCDAR